MSEKVGMVHYGRGTVWWVSGNSAGRYSHVQSKSRPAVIVSSDHPGVYSVVTVAFLTTKTEKSYRSCNVPVIVNGEEQVVLCNQIKTVDVEDLNTYYGVFDRETMKEIDKGILYCHGFGDLVEFYENVEKIKDLVSRQEITQDKDSRIEVLDEIIADLNKSLIDAKSKFESRKSLEEDLKNNPNLPPQWIAADHGVKIETPQVYTETVTTPSTPEKRTRTKWTKETAAEFLKDKKTLPLSEVKEKWGLTSASVYATYSRLKKEYEDSETN